VLCAEIKCRLQAKPVFGEYNPSMGPAKAFQNRTGSILIA
jgi:hypothetical protein